MFFMYILQSIPTGRFYIGSSQNLASRLLLHNAGKVPATKPFRPWKIVYSESFPTRSLALRRERQIKSWKNPEFMIKTLGIDNSPG